jgi:hypothetical protein
LPLTNSPPLVREGLIDALENELRSSDEAPEAADAFSDTGPRRAPEAHMFSETQTPAAHVISDTGSQ